VKRAGCDRCHLDLSETRRLMITTDTGISWTWQLCAERCYSLVLGALTGIVQSEPRTLERLAKKA